MIICLVSEGWQPHLWKRKEIMPIVCGNRPDPWDPGLRHAHLFEVVSGGGRSSAADVDAPAFEECASEREARMRERELELEAKIRDRKVRCIERMISINATYRDNISHTNPLYTSLPSLILFTKPTPNFFSQQGPPDFPPIPLPFTQ